MIEVSFIFAKKSSITLKMNHEISGFSKLSKSDKIEWIAHRYFSEPKAAITLIKKYWNADEKLQQLHDDFIENIIK